MNEWLDMFGLESIWNDPEWPTIEYRKRNYEEINMECCGDSDRSRTYLFYQIKNG